MTVAQLIERLKVFNQDLPVKSWDPERGVWIEIGGVWLEKDNNGNEVCSL